MNNNKNQPNANAFSLDNSRNLGMNLEEAVYFDTQNSDPNFRDQESEINLESIITAPMVAVSKANSVMLSGQSEFILDYCFDKKTSIDNEVVYEPKMIKLMVQNSLEEVSTVNVPLLTLLPINSLAIDKLKVKFNMQITSISSYKADANNSLDRKAQLSGKLSGECKNKDNELPLNKNLSVYVEASKLPLPNGLLNIIDMYSKIM